MVKVIIPEKFKRKQCLDCLHYKNDLCTRGKDIFKFLKKAFDDVKQYTVIKRNGYCHFKKKIKNKTKEK